MLATEDVTSATTRLVAHKSELADLQELIADLQAKLRVANVRREELQVSIAACETLLEPSTLHRRFSNEVMCEIFYAYRDSIIPSQKKAEELALLNDPRPRLAELQAAQNLPLAVCRRWSDILYSTPRYWRLQLLLYPRSGSSVEHRARQWTCIQDRLDRARDTPLYVILSLMDSEASLSDEIGDLNGMWLFKKCAKHIQTLVLPRRPTESLNMTSLIPETHLSQLKQLIRGPGHSLFKNGTDIHSLKSLRSFSTEIVPGPQEKASSTVTRLHIYKGHIAFKALCDILSAMPQLLHLRLNCTIHSQASHVYSHPNLLSLLGPNPATIMHHFTFPKLRSLEVRSVGRPWPSDGDIAFLERCQSIEHLMISGTDGLSGSKSVCDGPTSVALPNALYSLPALRTVNIYGMSVPKPQVNIFPTRHLVESSKLKSSRPERFIIPPQVVDFTFPKIMPGQLNRFQTTLERILEDRGHSLKHIGVESTICSMPSFEKIIDQLAEAGIVVDGRVYEFPSYEDC